MTDASWTWTELTLYALSAATLFYVVLLAVARPK